MNVFLIACFVAAATAARLDNTYLPPAGAGGSGGSGNFLNTPFGRGGAGAGHSSGAGGPGGPGGPGSAGGASGTYSGGPHGRTGEASAKILRFNSDNDGLGNYHYQYETENHIMAQEAGQLKNAGSDAEAVSAQGGFSYTGPDGQTYSINYVADENGFQPSGAHLPTPPPIPEEILKSLQQNAAEEARGGGQGGSGGPGGFGGAFGPGTRGAHPGSGGASRTPSQSFSPQTGYNY